MNTFILYEYSLLSFAIQSLPLCSFWNSLPRYQSAVWLRTSSLSKTENVLWMLFEKGGTEDTSGMTKVPSFLTFAFVFFTFSTFISNTHKRAHSHRQLRLLSFLTPSRNSTKPHQQKDLLKLHPVLNRYVKWHGKHYHVFVDDKCNPIWIFRKEGTGGRHKMTQSSLLLLLFLFAMKHPQL